MTQRSSRPQERLEHRAPSDCPVCGDELAVIRLGCGSCGTEIGGLFRPCEFCALNEKETEMLRVFLASRGNLREVEKVPRRLLSNSAATFRRVAREAWPRRDA